MIYHGTDTGRVFFCTNGAGNTWVEQSRFTGPVTIDNNAIVSGQIRMPLKILHDNVSDQMNPFAHQERHQIGNEDYLRGTVVQILNSGTTATQILAQTGSVPLPVTVIQSLAFDFTGRSGVSTIQIFAPVFFQQDGNSNQVDMSGNFFLDGVEIANPNSTRLQWEIDILGEQAVTFVAFLQSVTAGPHTLEIRVGVEQNITPLARDRMIMVTDLGLT